MHSFTFVGTNYVILQDISVDIRTRITFGGFVVKHCGKYLELTVDFVIQ